MPSDSMPNVQTLNKEAESLRLQEPERALELAKAAERLAREQGESLGLAESLLNIGAACWRLARYEIGKVKVREALALFESIDDVRGKATAFQLMGNLHQEMNEPNDALTAHQESLKWAERTGDKKFIANSLNNIAILYGMFANYTAALEALLKSLALRQELGDRYGEASTRNNIGLVYKLNQDYQNAITEYEASLKMFETLNLKKETAQVFGNLGSVFERLNDYERALHHHAQALLRYKELEFLSGVATAKHNIGIVYGRSGEREKARAYISESLSLAETLSDSVVIAHACLNLGRLHAAQRLD